MYYVYMLWCRDDTLYTGTASDLCRRMRQHRDGGAACARYTRSHPPRELAGVWRTEGRGADLLPGVAAEPVPGVTLAMCLEGEFHE